MRSGPRSLSISLQDFTRPDKMADGRDAAAQGMTTPPGSPTPRDTDDTEGRPTQTGIDNEAIVKAVALLLKPLIQEAVENSLQQGLHKINTAMAESKKRMGEVELRVSLLEDENQEDHSTITTLEHMTLQMQEKLDDLEKRSRRNNLRIVGLPEQYKAGELYKICTLPQALGLATKCTVERAHRLGGFIPDSKTPWQVIVRYLNYADKNSILQKFRI